MTARPDSNQSWAARKKVVEVLGRKIAYIEQDKGQPIVFLHGNPTSSYLWRNVMPHLHGQGRLIAPDLIGMGDSDKLPENEPDRYRLVCHARYLDAFLEAIGVTENVILVLHDWGGALGFDWAFRHQKNVRAIAYMETFVCPLQLDDLPKEFHPTLNAVRSEKGISLVLDENMFIEKMLPGVTQRTLTDEEMAEYRRPYLTPGDDRMPTLVWPREVPLSGVPADVTKRIEAYSNWLKTANVPKLFLNANPGVFIKGRVESFCQTLPYQQEIGIEGMHFIQEDRPDDVGRSISNWLSSL